MARPALALCPKTDRSAVCRLVEDHLSLVSHLVRERLSKVPAHVSRDELTSAGMMALVLSAQSFEPDRGVPFERFAAIRIRGALMDELRGMDWATRSVRSRAREVESVRGELAAVLARAPRQDEVADAARLSRRELDVLQSDLARASVLSLQTFSAGAEVDVPSDSSAGPESLILQRERLGYLHDAIAEMSDRLRFVVHAYFFEQRQMSDIALDLGVTQSRVSQLCTEALCLLRDGLNLQLDPAAVGFRLETGRAATARNSYFQAIARRGNLSSRLAMSTARGDMLYRDRVARAKIA